MWFSYIQSLIDAPTPIQSIHSFLTPFSCLVLTNAMTERFSEWTNVQMLASCKLLLQFDCVRMQKQVWVDCWFMYWRFAYFHVVHLMLLVDFPHPAWKNRSQAASNTKKYFATWSSVHGPMDSIEKRLWVMLRYQGQVSQRIPHDSPD